MTHFIFVYGTLRKESEHPARHYLNRYGQFYSEGSMQGCLYEIAGYPGAIAGTNPEHRIKGDIFKITRLHTLLNFLDEYEECSQRFAEPHEYIRVQRNITSLNGQQIKGWVYLYNRSVNQRKKIIDGDYFEYLRKNQKKPFVG